MGVWRADRFYKMFNVLEKIIIWALAVIAKFKYAGIFLTMSLESAAIPIPSEVVLPFSGFLASSGRLNFWLIITVATLANLTGAIAIYLVGFYGGRTLLERYGRYVLVHKDEIAKMDSWLGKHGAGVAFFSRLLPGIKTFSSLIIGAGKINFRKFFFYTLAGSFVWNLPLTYLGFAAGNNWDFLRPYFRKFDFVILAAIIVAVILFVFKHVHKLKKLRRHP